MKMTACQYVMIRFSPYVETGEFANVGILIMAHKQRYFDFKLATHHHKRVTNFFDKLEPRHYRSVLQTFEVELKRLQTMINEQKCDGHDQTKHIDFMQSIFSELIRPRGNSVRFSQPRIVLAKEPKSKLIELYQCYVEQNFVKTPNRANLASVSPGVEKLVGDRGGIAAP